MRRHVASGFEEHAPVFVDGHEQVLALWYAQFSLHGELISSLSPGGYCPKSDT